MPKYAGTLMFDVEIETQDSEAEVENISQAVLSVIRKVPGVVGVDQVDDSIEEVEEES